MYVCNMINLLKNAIEICYGKKKKRMERVRSRVFDREKR